jgi:hypothetical protein
MLDQLSPAASRRTAPCADILDRSGYAVALAPFKPTPRGAHQIGSANTTPPSTAVPDGDHAG